MVDSYRQMLSESYCLAAPVLRAGAYLEVIRMRLLLSAVYLYWGYLQGEALEKKRKRFPVAQHYDIITRIGKIFHSPPDLTRSYMVKFQFKTNTILVYTRLILFNNIPGSTGYQQFNDKFIERFFYIF